MCTPECLDNPYIDWDNPINNLRFEAIKPNFDGPDATFKIFQNGVHTATEVLIGLGGGGNKGVDLSAYNNITRLEIVDILVDPVFENGIGGTISATKLSPNLARWLLLASAHS